MSKDVSDFLQNAKTEGETLRSLDKQQKKTEKTVVACEVEIAKMISSLVSSGCTNLTVELVSVVSALVVSVCHRYTETPEDFERMVSVMTSNINDLSSFMLAQIREIEAETIVGDE
ncbi:MAG: hypothetical protein BV459_07325 [Thermoplasmata archaeon M11B2D]|nr:MAG: hypothetical protein BV459_07325 [Thermoplasmata archaeon M11B2D]